MPQPRLPPSRLPHRIKRRIRPIHLHLVHNPQQPPQLPLRPPMLLKPLQILRRQIINRNSPWRKLLRPKLPKRHPQPRNIRQVRRHMIRQESLHTPNFSQPHPTRSSPPPNWPAEPGRAKTHLVPHGYPEIQRTRVSAKPLGFAFSAIFAVKPLPQVFTPHPHISCSPQEDLSASGGLVRLRRTISNPSN